MKNVLDEDIKKGEFSTVYLLYGEEEFLKQSYKKQLRSAIAGDDTMNLNIFTGRDIDVREIINLSETMPFFADRRLILVEDSGFFKKGQEELAEYLPKVPESTCIVFVEQEVDKRNRLYKAVKEHGRIAELARQEEKDLIMWAARYLKKNGKSVSASTLEELLMRTGQDMNNIMSELDKLVAYVGDRDAVTVEDVREAVTSRTENRIFEMVRELRGDVAVPMVFMTYANVVFSYGAERFISTCAGIGIDGLILPDLPFEEKEEFLAVCRAHGVALISLIAPTSANRVAMIAKEAEGFIYLVSSLGVTGVRSSITTDLGPIIRTIRENTDVPCAVGFGISNPEQAKTMAKEADGVIVGSAIVKLIAQYGKDAAAPVGAFVKEMKDAVR